MSPNPVNPNNFGGMAPAFSYKPGVPVVGESIAYQFSIYNPDKKPAFPKSKTLEEYDLISNKNVLIHSGDVAESSPGIYINEESVILYTADGKTSVTISKNEGVSIMGHLAIQAMPDEIRLAGLWKLNPLILTALPSTLYTPIPVLKQSVPKPSKTLSQGIASAAALIAGL